MNDYLKILHILKTIICKNMFLKNNKIISSIYANQNKYNKFTLKNFI